MRSYRWVGFVSALVLASLACSLIPNPLQSSSSSGEDPPPPSSNVLMTDDFSDPNSGWEIGEYRSGSVGYSGGVYFVLSVGQGSTMWGVANRSFGDVDIEVEAMQVKAPPNDNNDYGVVCRLQPNDDGYYLLITGDGFYTIMIRDQGEFIALVDWTSTNVVRQGNSSNQVRAICQGSSLSLYTNGDLLSTVQDSTFSQGDIALTATSYEDSETEVHFDNLSVREP